MDISKRLRTVASLVRCETMADIGTDHGYVPLYLYEQGKIKKALACDLNPGPLEKARENIQKMGAGEVIETRLGSGLTPVVPGEVECAVIAGMGGMLICHILEDSEEVAKSLKEWVLSPQHDMEAVRRLVHRLGYAIDREELVLEDGKYYDIFRCVPGKEKYGTLAEYRYGAGLLGRKDAVLWEKLCREEKQYNAIAAGLARKDTENAAERLTEVEEVLKCIREAKAWYE